MENKAIIYEHDSAAFRVGYPVLWLLLTCFIVYFPTFFYGFTELDDYTLILNSGNFNQHLSSLIASYHRGVFQIADSHYFRYYRPVFLDSIVLNYQLSGKTPAGYHIANVCFHTIAVILLYKLYIKMGIQEMHAFLLCLLFAVHPVLTQAVAWIPGRNDTLLAIFTFSFLLCSINYARDGTIKQLLLSCIFLLLALFTKETAVVIPIAAFILMVFVLRTKWYEKRNIIQYVLWIGALVILVIVRATANMKPLNLSPKLVASDLAHRVPVIVQYLGKIFFPLNLSAFPSMQNTSYVYGILAIVLISAVIYLSKKKSWPLIISGLSLFIIFLLPVFLQPHGESRQPFEHRLYLPLAGLLLMLPQTVLLKNHLTGRQLLVCYISIACIFAAINFHHQRTFANPLVFWSKVAATDNTSATAFRICAANTVNPAASYRLFALAYKINPNEKFLNYCRGVKLQQEDSILASQPYLIAEKKISDYYECDYYLAKIAIKKNDWLAAITYLQTYLNNDPENTSHIKNVLLTNPAWRQPASAKKKALDTIHPGMALDIIKELGL